MSSPSAMTSNKKQKLVDNVSYLYILTWLFCIKKIRKKNEKMKLSNTKVEIFNGFQYSL